jgi:hypothetical protein
MNASYKITWRNNQNGRAGHSKAQYTKEEAEALVKELNEDYPHMTHTVEEIAEEAVAA